MTAQSGLRGQLTRKAQSRTGLAGFSLIELLTVLTIIAIISTIAVTSIPLLQRSNQIDSSIALVTGIMEQAREVSISSNTYVWVAFSDPPTTGNTQGCWVAIIQSLDGTDSAINSGTSTTPVWATSVTIPSGNLQLLSKVQFLPGVKIKDASALPTSVTSQAPTGATTLFETGVSWTVTPLQASSGSTIPFTHVIEFAPVGDARVPTWNNNIQFGLLPVQGASTANAALCNVSRLTGKMTVYRP